MKYIYNAFDLNISSNNIKLPELNKANNKKFDIEIIKTDTNYWERNIPFEYKYNNLLINKNELRLHVKGIADFMVSEGKKILWRNTNKNFSENEIRAYLLGSTIGAILIQRNNLVLHASALTKANKTIICLGDGGVGKSTLAYSLMIKGWKLLSDDLVALSEDLYVLPGIPRIKLWEDAIIFYGLCKNTLKRVRNDMNKYQLSGDLVTISLTKSKATTIYILDKEVDKQTKREIKGDKIKLFNLISNIYRPLYVKGFNKQISYHKKIINIIKQLPIYKLSLPRKLSEMENWIDRNEFDL